MSATAGSAYEWKTLPWKRFERTVFKLQTRIYQAQRRGNRPAVHRLQRLLTTSWSAKCLAVRRVTQDNRGKRTAGVDGVKALTPPQRLALARSLSLSARARPTRRVWIPKAGTTEHRPLGIPTLRDRAAQALLKLALEPEWEAQFELNSYGFRPGRSAHDAIEAIYRGVRLKAKYVLDADIAQCFDRIDHVALLQKLQTTPHFRRVLRAWLKAGVLEGATVFPTEAGTPQGGVISPLLANIALHGLETAIRTAVPQRSPVTGADHWRPLVVRYADDFVVMHPDLVVIEQARQQVITWLAARGLELKASKTRIVHTLREHHGAGPGFDFLGFTVRQYPVGKTHSGKRARGAGLLGFKTHITPSRAAQRRHGAVVKAIVRQYQAAPQAALIHRLNPVIRGWSRYYATVVATTVFSTMDNHLYLRLRRWAKRRHPHKAMDWVVKKYWRLETGTWDFATRGGERLYRYRQTPIRRHVKVAGDRTPFDGDWRYWATRLGRHPELPTRVAALLRGQHGRCAWCGLRFRDGDGWEVDHVIPRACGGTDTWQNCQLLHGHCHDQKSAGDGSHAGVPMTMGHRREEPDERKRSRPVLQTSR